MVNQEVLGGLVSALSRGESLHNAMFSLFNAGYKKADIEDAARMLQSQTPVQISQKMVENKKIEKSKKGKAPEKKIKGLQKSKLPVQKEKIEKAKQNISKYSEKEDFGKFDEIIKETIRNLQGPKSSIEVVKGNGSKPPIIIQKVSDYGNAPRKKISKPAIIILILLLVLSLAALSGLFVFKSKVIEFLNNFNF